MIYSRKGLTLLEILISLIILSLVALLISQTYSFISRSVGKEYIVIPEKAKTLMKLRYLINSIFPYVVKDRNSYFFYFKGNKENLSFVSLYDFKNSTSSKRPFLYEIYQKNNRVYLRQVAIFPNRYVDPVTLRISKLGKEDVLPLPFSRISFAYYTEKSFWKEKIVGKIPYAVRIRAVFLSSEKEKVENIMIIKARNDDKIKLTKFLYLSRFD